MAEKFADKLFECHIEYLKLVDKFADHLIKSIGISPQTAWTKELHAIPFEDWSFDYYDRSFQLKDVEAGFEYPQSAREYMARIGFTRCWIHYEAGSEEYETHPRGKFYLLKRAE